MTSWNAFDQNTRDHIFMFGHVGWHTDADVAKSLCLGEGLSVWLTRQRLENLQLVHKDLIQLWKNFAGSKSFI